MTSVTECAICGATPNVFFNGQEYRVIHNAPCANRGNFTVAEYSELNALTITLKEDEYEIIEESQESIAEEVLPEVVNGP